MIKPIGYFKVWRDLFLKPIWLTSTPVQKTILITLLAMANYNDNEWEWNNQKFNVLKGQFVTSIDSIKANCGNGVTTQNVRTALTRFEKLGFLTSQSTNRGRLITIENWCLYQSDEKNQQVNSQALNKHLTSNSQALNKHLTTKEERKKDKNTNKEKKDNILESANAELNGNNVTEMLPYKEKEIEKETEIEIKTYNIFESANAELQAIIDSYNSICTKLPKAVRLTQKRKTAIRKFLKEFSQEDFETICSNANQSEFYTGNNDRHWRADIDFLLRTDKALKLLEVDGTASYKDKYKPVEDEGIVIG